MSRTRILVIDDEPQTRRFLRPALEASGYAVERAGMARNGLAMAQARLLILSARDQEGPRSQRSTTAWTTAWKSHSALTSCRPASARRCATPTPARRQASCSMATA